jgi:hypothetical protein
MGFGTHCQISITIQLCQSLDRTLRVKPGLSFRTKECHMSLAMVTTAMMTMMTTMTTMTTLIPPITHPLALLALGIALMPEM